MPRHDWKCTCGAITEVVRSMDCSNVGPRNHCRSCGGTSFKKQVAKTHALIPGGRSESSPWPICIPKMEKFMLRGDDGEVLKNSNGVPLVGYKDVVFTSKAHQDQYLKEHGKALMMDGEADSTVNVESTHSVYDQTSIAPSEYSTKLAEQSFFVEDPNEVSEDIILSKALALGTPTTVA